jgi:hypothetical protein
MSFVFWRVASLITASGTTTMSELVENMSVLDVMIIVLKEIYRHVYN